MYFDDGVTWNEEFLWLEIQHNLRQRYRKQYVERQANRKSIYLKEQPYKLEVVKTASTFKPGFPYSVTVTAYNTMSDRFYQQLGNSLLNCEMEIDILTGNWEALPYRLTVPLRFGLCRQRRPAQFPLKPASQKSNHQLLSVNSTHQARVSCSFIHNLKTYRWVRLQSSASTLRRTHSIGLIRRNRKWKGSFSISGKPSWRLLLDRAVILDRSSSGFSQLFQFWSSSTRLRILLYIGCTSIQKYPYFWTLVEKILAPRTRLLVYYVRPDSGVVANVIDFTVSGLLQNKLWQ